MAALHPGMCAFIYSTDTGGTMYMITTDLSCGVGIAYDLTKDARYDAASIAFHMFRRLDPKYDYDKVMPRPTHAFVIFSDAVEGPEVYDQNGVELARYLAAEDLGEVVASNILKNPNTENEIQVWIFHPDHRRFYDWLTKQTDLIAELRSGERM
jgi:hypothetical protein